MSDPRDDETREDRPRQPHVSGADAGAGASGSGLSASDKAQNAETVLDPDQEPDDPADELVDQIDRLERHSRPTTSPAREDPSASPDVPPA